MDGVSNLGSLVEIRFQGRMAPSSIHAIQTTHHRPCLLSCPPSTGVKFDATHNSLARPGSLKNHDILPFPREVVRAVCSKLSLMCFNVLHEDILSNSTRCSALPPSLRTAALAACSSHLPYFPICPHHYAAPPPLFASLVHRTCGRVRWRTYLALSGLAPRA